MWKMLAVSVSLSAMLLGGCSWTSFGASIDGTIPPKPSGASYPSWEHLCLVLDTSNATEILVKSGDEGWELASLGLQGSNTLACFKRPK